MKNKKIITDCCLLWEANDMRNAIVRYSEENHDAPLSDDDVYKLYNDDRCNEMLGKFFEEYSHTIMNEIFELMDIWIKQNSNLHQVSTNMNGLAGEVHGYTNELNKLIGRKAFNCRATDDSPYPFSKWIINGTGITDEEVETLNLRTDFIIN
jgi:hypothetical protein